MSEPPKILIQAWAAMRYSPAPSDWVLRRWCRDGEIHPPPERVAGKWYVSPNARRISAASPTLLEQLTA